MSVLQSVKCKSGLHQWSAWKYLETPEHYSSNCQSERECLDCHKKVTRDGESHTWGEWVSAGQNSCAQEHTCSRCKFKETRFEHAWGAWDEPIRVGRDLGWMVKVDEVRQRVCKRCGEKGTENIFERIHDNIIFSVKHCYQCDKQIREVNMSRGVMTIGGSLPELYDGVICTKCERMVCTECKGTPLDAPCKWCGSEVSPAYKHIVQRNHATII